MKKLISVFLILALTSVILAGCGSPGGANPQGPERLTAVVAGLPEHSPSGIALKRFAELVAEYSEGSLEIDTFFGQELGSLVAAVEGMTHGTIDIVSTGTSFFAGHVPEIQVFELPYIFATDEEARATLDGVPGDVIREMFIDHGIYLLCYWESGLRHVTNSRGPIMTPADMSGLTIRTVVSITQQRTWESFGALPMALDMGETFTALQQGTVDAQENTLAQIVALNMFEVQDYLSLTSHAYTPMPFGISMMTWDRLDDNQREAIRRASKEARDYQRELNSISDIENLQFLRDQGMTIEENPDRQSFASLVQPVFDLFIDQVGTDRYLNMVLDYVNSLR